MLQSGFAHSALTAAGARIFLGVVVLLAILVLGCSTGAAMPPASGSKCNANWVNNSGALNCFIQGEEDIRNGVAHPHYVACTAAGEIFCCVDGNNGGQNCEAQARAAVATVAEQVRALLNAQLSMSMALGRLSNKLESLDGKISKTLRNRPAESR